MIRARDWNEANLPEDTAPLTPQPGDVWPQAELPLAAPPLPALATWRFYTEAARCVACGARYHVHATRALPVVATTTLDRDVVHERRCPCGASVWSRAAVTQAWHHVPATLRNEPPADPPTALHGLVLRHLLDQLREDGRLAFDTVVQLAPFGADPIVAAWQTSVCVESMVEALELADPSRGWWACEAVARAAGSGPVASEPGADGEQQVEPAAYVARTVGVRDTYEYEVRPVEGSYLCAAIRAACPPPTLAEVEAGAARRRAAP